MGGGRQKSQGKEGVQDWCLVIIYSLASKLERIVTRSQSVYRMMRLNLRPSGGLGKGLLKHRGCRICLALFLNQ